PRHPAQLGAAWPEVTLPALDRIADTTQTASDPSRTPTRANAAVADRENPGIAADNRARARSNGRALHPLSQMVSSSEAESERIADYPTAGTVNDGSVGSVTLSSRSHPSFS